MSRCISRSTVSSAPSVHLRANGPRRSAAFRRPSELPRVVDFKFALALAEGGRRARRRASLSRSLLPARRRRHERQNGIRAGATDIRPRRRRSGKCDAATPDSGFVGARAARAAVHDGGLDDVIRSPCSSRRSPTIESRCGQAADRLAHCGRNSPSHSRQMAHHCRWRSLTPRRDGSDAREPPASTRAWNGRSTARPRRSNRREPAVPGLIEYARGVLLAALGRTATLESPCSVSSLIPIADCRTRSRAPRSGNGRRMV